MGESQSVDYSEEFYKHHARRYSEVSHQLLQSVYVSSSHPALKTDMDLLECLTGLVSGGRGLDAGCGAGARDVHHLWNKGLDVYGIDAVEENIQEARALHPEIADRVQVADLRDSLDFANESFDFVICNAVIQHIEPENLPATLSEFARVLRPEGVLQLMFKNGTGVITVFDRDYGAERSFHLYDEAGLLDRLKSHHLLLVEPSKPEGLGGIMYFTDPKPVDHCVFYVRKS